MPAASQGEQAQLQPGSVLQVPISLQGDLLFQRHFQLFGSVLEEFIFFFKKRQKGKKPNSSWFFLVCGWSRAFPRASAMRLSGRQMEKVSTRAELASSRAFGGSSCAPCVKWAPLVHGVLFNWFRSVEPCTGNAAGQILCWVLGSCFSQKPMGHMD